jgi:hypothetical protein
MESHHAGLIGWPMALFLGFETGAAGAVLLGFGSVPQRQRTKRKNKTAQWR